MGDFEDRGQRDQATVESVVQESLGLTADDLGMDPLEGGLHDLPDEMFQDGNEDTQLDPSPRRVQNRQEDTAPHPTQQRQQQNDDFFAAPQNDAPQGLPANAEVRGDGKGNLVDKKTGQIVARAGAEARMYQKLHTTTRAMESLQQQHTDVTQRLNKAVEIGTQLHDDLKTLRTRFESVSPQKYGLQDKDAIDALTMAKQAQTDPVGVIKTLLTRAVAGGIDLSSIGLAPGGFDPKVLMDMVRGEMQSLTQPIREAEDQRQKTAREAREASERETAAVNDLNTFLGQNPAARNYLPVFHQVYSQPRFQHMTLNEVWARLQLNLMQKGIDPTKPPQQQRPENRNQRQQRPMPNGRRMPPANRAPETMAPVSASYEDIIRGILE